MVGYTWSDRGSTKESKATVVSPSNNTMVGYTWSNHGLNNITKCYSGI